MCEFDSRPDTLFHALRVGELMGQPITELVERSTCHDRSKTQPPELAIFDKFTPLLRDTTYGSDEYKAHLEAMGEGLKHHYAHNRHHPEHFKNGIDGMTLVDLIEMLADWKAATERHTDGDLYVSLAKNRARFGMSSQLTQLLYNTARHYGWLTQACGSSSKAPDGTVLTCNVLLDGHGWHWGPCSDGKVDGGQNEWWISGRSIQISVEQS